MGAAYKEGALRGRRARIISVPPRGRVRGRHQEQRGTAAVRTITRSSAGSGSQNTWMATRMRPTRPAPIAMVRMASSTWLYMRGRRLGVGRRRFQRKKLQSGDSSARRFDPMGGPGFRRRFAIVKHSRPGVCKKESQMARLAPFLKRQQTRCRSERVRAVMSRAGLVQSWCTVRRRSLPLVLTLQPPDFSETTNVADKSRDA